MHRYKLAILSTVMVTGSVLAANPTINVSGKITPPACNASIIGGGTLVWEPVSHNSLSNTTFTALAAKPATLQVTCESGLNTRMAFWSVDANAGSAIPGINVPGTSGGSNGANPARIYGIGLDPVTNNKIGNFSLIGKTSSYDGTENDQTIGYVDNGSGHNSESFGVANFSAGWGLGSIQEWTVLDVTTKKPAVANSFTFTFDVVPQINKKSQITNSQEVPFSGSVQFFVRYF
ncbi:DUF1120 domain-containing protein [Enterobacteriaceae bacterium RIT693]|jgi:hypothetical protein|nr:DUF1120 domain-containing protein [Enterobacteriaceae bacterium RIT693]